MTQNKWKNFYKQKVKYKKRNKTVHWAGALYKTNDQIFFVKIKILALFYHMCLHIVAVIHKK